jgi:hypothetical protein
MGVSGAHRASLVVDVSLPVLWANPAFRYTVLCELVNKSFGVIYANDGVEMMGHFVSFKWVQFGGYRWTWIFFFVISRKLTLR